MFKILFYLCLFLSLLLKTNASFLPFKTIRDTSGTNGTENGTIHATLSQINTTHCNVDLVNKYDRPLDFLTWNSLFDSQTESFSFVLKSSSTNEKVPIGSTMLRKIYADVHPDHVLTIAAHSSWSGVFDLTRLFDIPRDGDYDVSLTRTLTTLSQPKYIRQPAHVKVETPMVVMKLVKSPSTLRPRLDFSDNAKINTCDAAQQWVIQQTVAQAANLAMNAKKAIPLSNPVVGYRPNQDLYKEYFNDNSQQTVFDIYDRASKYDLMANPGLGLTFYCNTDAQRSDYCSTQQGVVGYAPAVGSYAYVTLCNIFFENIWSSTLCNLPGTTTPTPGTTYLEWQDPTMQAGIVLHELMHCHLVVQTSNIVDGPDASNQGGINYAFEGVSDLAQNAATNGDAPLTNSQNFVFFAQAVTNAVAPAPCNCCSFGGPSLSYCSGLPNSPACGACTCGGLDPNPQGS